MTDSKSPFFLLTVMLTMPLSIVQVSPLSMTVTAALTFGLSTAGKLSAA
jgi:hypothetical protein